MKPLFTMALAFFLQIKTMAAPSLNPNCDWTGTDWDRFMQNELLSPENGPEQILDLLKEKKASCSQKISSDHLKACTARAEGYYSQFVNKSSNYMYSAILPDDEYIKSQPAGVLELPEEFKKSSNGLPSNWEEIAAKNGWKWALFHSETAREPRLVFYIPGEKWDRLLVYYSFNARDISPSSWVGIQMQAIEKKPKTQAKSEAPPQYYFKSWGFEGDERIPKTNHSGGRCVKCHISGPRAIVPSLRPAFETRLGGVSSITELNNLMVRDGELDYSPYYDMKHFPKNLQVGKDCVACHDGKGRQSLAFSVSHDGEFYSENVHRKVKREQTMPLGDQTLDFDSRHKMAKGVVEDYKNQLRSWISGVSCVTGKSTETKNGSAGASEDKNLK